MSNGRRSAVHRVPLLLRGQPQSAKKIRGGLNYLGVLPAAREWLGSLPEIRCLAALKCFQDHWLERAGKIRIFLCFANPLVGALIIIFSFLVSRLKFNP